MEPKHVFTKKSRFDFIFWWAVPIIRLGSRRKLTKFDSATLPQTSSVQHLGNTIHHLWNKECNSTFPSLKRTLWKMFGMEYIKHTTGIIIANSVIKVVLPFASGILISYANGTLSKTDGYTAGVIFLILTFLNTIINHQSTFSLQHLAMKMRVTITSLILRTILKRKRISDNEMGKITNIVSNDMNRFDRGLLFVPFVIAGPIQVILATVVLLYISGPVCLPGVFYLIFMAPFQAVFGRVFGKIRLKVARRTDARINYITEIINSMLFIKMSAWEDIFEKLVTSARRHEMTAIRLRAIFTSINSGVFYVSTKISLALTFLTYYASSVPMTPKDVFVTLAMYNAMAANIGPKLTQAVILSSEILTSIKRIQDLLLTDTTNRETSFPMNLQHQEKTRFNLENVSFSWSIDANPAIKNISLQGEAGEFIGVTGTVGSGKSTLLQVLLNENSGPNGVIEVNGSIAYVPQTPWIFSGTVRDNIVFGLPLNKEWYAEVLEACALTNELRALPDGDHTLMTDIGVTLSGGQKARICLARAVYANSDIYLLDDVLSAVDVKVVRELLNNCIRRLLKNKCVVLVSHQVHLLQAANRIILLRDGEIERSGTYDELFGKIATETSSTAVDDILESEKETTSIVQKETETKTNGYGTFNGRKNGQDEENETFKKGGMAAYFRAGNSNMYLLFVLMLYIVGQAFNNGSDIWLQKWSGFDQDKTSSDLKTAEYNDSNYYYLIVYIVLVGIVLIFSIWRALVLYLACISSSNSLHQSLLSSILKAPMWFFEQNYSGRILNRFSNDVGNMDENVPLQTYLLIASLAQTLGSIIVIIINSQILIIPSIVLILAILYLRNFYIKPALNIKQLESVARSPVLDLISRSMAGLSVIKSFNAQSHIQSNYHENQDVHSSLFYTYLGTSRWVQMFSELLTNIYITAVVIYIFIIPTASSTVGLFLASLLMLSGSLSLVMSQSIEVENQFVSVERVLEYANNIPMEPQQESQFKDPLWPYKGELKFDNVSVVYGDGNEVLTDINVDIKSGEKIGIVGRTGSGKSTLISALFLIVRSKRGRIHIDSIDISKIDLRKLRTNISIIPQNPVLFSGTLRQNLDPYELYSDDTLWNALSTVQMDSRVKNSCKHGLYEMVSAKGSNFSQGEKQLICLARAILKNSKLVILDEATANIDTECDAIIQKAIRDKFHNATILTIAHRLETIMESSKVLVLDGGRIKEMDTLQNLLSNQDGIFYAMVERTGKNNATRLRQMAGLKM